MSNIDEIKSRIDIVDLVSETVKLRRAGKNFSGLCPFHSEKTPSFIVSPQRGTWRCFGQCNEGGDIFSFVMKKEGWDFKEALRYLASKAGVALQAYTPQQQEQKDAHERLRDLLEQAVTFYRHQLMNTPEGQAALVYLQEQRHLSDSTIETFGLGYAPDTWDAVFKHFMDKGYNEQDLIDAGLQTLRDSGGSYDRFRNRVVFPIRDERGRMTGFGARVLNPEDVPKFLNSPETALFSKSHLLYGLDRARKAIRAADQAIIVEGYFDVIALHQAGFENVVSPMGTALTEDQLRLLKRFTPSNRIILALDPDAAGQAAVLRGLDAARQALDRETETGFDARGLLRHEARLQADLRVVSLPDDLDPDELVQRDPKEWEQLIKQAQPIVLHVMETLAQGRELEDAKIKAEISAQVLPLIDDLPNPVERDSYRQRLARFLKVDERALLSMQTPGRKALRVSRTKREKFLFDQRVGRQQAPSPVEAHPAAPSEKLETHTLSILLTKPDLLFRLDRALGEAGLNQLTSQDFGYTDHQMLFRLVKQSLEQDELSPQAFVSKYIPISLVDAVDEMFSQSAEYGVREQILVEDILRAVVKIRRLDLDESINQLRFLIEEAYEQGDLRISAYNQLAYQKTRERDKLDQAVKRKEIVDRQ
jgi:DNA primase